MNLEKLLEYYLLIEGQFDVWLTKNPNQNTEQAKKYFDDLTTRYSASLHPSTKDLTNLSFIQLETLHKAVAKAKEKNLKPLLIQWLTKQIKDRNLDSNAIEEDYIPVLQLLAKHKDLMKPEFLDQIDSIEKLNQELNKVAPAGTMSVASDTELGKVAEKNGWGLYMPHTTEASCELGKTGGRRDTTWCTTRTEGQNLFLGYAGRVDKDVILFYVIKRGVNAENDPFAKMSIGFINGNPKFNQGDNNITVNANNKNLTEEKFKEELGEQLATEFLALMKQKSEEIKGKHPAKQEFEKLVQNPKAYFAKLDSFAKTEQGEEFKMDFIKQSLKYPNVSKEIFLRLVNSDYQIRLEIAKKPDAPIEVLIVLAEDGHAFIREEVARNEKTPADVLKTLAEDKENRVRAAVAANKSTPKETLERLTQNDQIALVRRAVATNENAPPEILSFLADEHNEDVLKAVAQNKNTPAKVLFDIATTADEEHYYWAIQFAARNPSLTVDYIKILLSSKPTLKSSIARNPITPKDILFDLGKNGNAIVRLGVADNKNAPPEILSILAKDHMEEQVRQAVASNPNTKTEDLIALSKDWDEEVANSAKTELENRNLAEKVLVKVLTKLLYL